MADFVFNVAKGRVVELFGKVRSNDPAAAALHLVPIDVAAITDATLKDLDTLAAIITAGATERTTNGWVRKTLTDTELTPVAYAPDDVNDRFDLDMPDQTWTAVGAGGGAITDLLLCYDALGTGVNANMMPLILFDFAITPDGLDIVAQVNSAGFFRAL